jgi:hypothetical protein
MFRHNARKDGAVHTAADNEVIERHISLFHGEGYSPCVFTPPPEAPLQVLATETFSGIQRLAIRHR